MGEPSRRVEIKVFDATTSVRHSLLVGWYSLKMAEDGFIPNSA